LVTIFLFSGRQVASVRVDLRADDYIEGDSREVNVVVEVPEFELSELANPITNRYRNKENKIEEDERKVKLIKSLELKNTTLDNLNTVF
jgi:hypothetical protein